MNFMRYSFPLFSAKSESDRWSARPHGRQAESRILAAKGAFRVGQLAVRPLLLTLLFLGLDDELHGILLRFGQKALQERAAAGARRSIVSTSVPIQQREIGFDSRCRDAGFRLQFTVDPPEDTLPPSLRWTDPRASEGNDVVLPPPAGSRVFTAQVTLRDGVWLGALAVLPFWPPWFYDELHDASFTDKTAAASVSNTDTRLRHAGEVL
jgi:hypothetical protein